MQTISGTHLGRYELVEVVGHGAMGIVYKALDPKRERFVAIKMISVLGEGPAQFFSSELTSEEILASKQRFLLEGKAASRLLHPGIVQVFDVGEDPETRIPYIVMEYVSGKPLHAYLADCGGKLPWQIALRICKSVAEALAYAHTQRVVHRDIKPANIMITGDGEPKIADFGVATIDLSYCTLPGELIGTPAYMAPEQLTSSEVDGRADLFSLGVILYSLLSGHRPFQGDGASTVTFKIMNHDPMPVSALEFQLPEGVDYVISRAIAKKPEKRYQTGTEMAQDIQDILDGKRPRSQAVIAERRRAERKRAETVEYSLDGSRLAVQAQKRDRNEVADRASVQKTWVRWYLLAALTAVLILGTILLCSALRRSPHRRLSRSSTSMTRQLWPEGQPNPVPVSVGSLIRPFSAIRI